MENELGIYDEGKGISTFGPSFGQALRQPFTLSPSSSGSQYNLTLTYNTLASFGFGMVASIPVSRKSAF